MYVVLRVCACRGVRGVLLVVLVLVLTSGFVRCSAVEQAEIGRDRA
jgi:hypothetical protein